MRIALVCPFDPWPRAAGERGGPSAAGRAHTGGVERVYAEIAPRLAARGHEVTLLTTTDGAAGRSREHDVEVVREHRRLTVFRAPMNRLTGQMPPADLVQVAATYPLTTPAVLRYAARERVPSVLDFHFEAQPPSAAGRAAAALYRSVGTRPYALASLILVRSLAYARSAPSLSRAPWGKMRVVPNGIDSATFRPRGESRREHILFVGRLVPYKGVDVLLRALAVARPSVPLVIAGEGPQRAHLERMARRLPVDVRFAGRVSDDELAELYRHARFTVLPSVNRQEAFGITLLESMACGTPVVASNLPGVAGVAALGGLLARPGNAGDLAFHLRRALDVELPSGPPLAARIHREYSWDAITDRLLWAYRDAVDLRPQAPERVPGVMPSAAPGRGPLL